MTKPNRLDKQPNAFITLAMADIEKIDQATGVSQPSAQAVEDARKWVNFNEK